MEGAEHLRRAASGNTKESYFAALSRGSLHKLIGTTTFYGILSLGSENQVRQTLSEFC